MEILQKDSHTIRISQPLYAQAILEEFGDITRSSNIPISKRAILNTGKAPAAEIAQFQRVIGKLMYFACNTRPDLMYAVIRASSCTQNP